MDITATQDTVQVVCSERGLSLAGTRITLYDIVGLLKADWPPRLIQHWLDISDKQLNAALHYIDAHQDEVEQEYQQVIKQAEVNRQYWETRNAERLAAIAALPPKPEFAAAYARLQARKAERGSL
jgi:hypothetical protein